MRTKSLPSPEALAKAFSLALREELTPSQLAEAIRRNRAETEPTICHSHDFTDPNEAMLAALESFSVELDLQDGEQTALWSAAWTMARQNEFWATPNA